ncbi:MAG TPA: hypothetical protein VGE39_13995 [Prosthecobacter sp.]
MASLLAAIIKSIVRAFQADQELADESLFGDTPERRSSRRVWQIGGVILLLVGIAAFMVLRR